MATRTRRTTSPKELRGELIAARAVIRFSKSKRPRYRYILRFRDGERAVSRTVDADTYQKYVVAYSGVPFETLLKHGGFLDDATAEAMLKAIEEGCAPCDG